MNTEEKPRQHRNLMQKQNNKNVMENIAVKYLF
jgi:hypothetical protein